MYDKIDARLEDMDGAACVNRFYSDKDNLVITCDAHIKDDVRNVIKNEFNWRLYDVGGAEHGVLMMTFKRP